MNVILIIYIFLILNQKYFNFYLKKKFYGSSKEVQILLNFKLKNKIERLGFSSITLPLFIHFHLLNCKFYDVILSVIMLIRIAFRDF